MRMLILGMTTIAAVLSAQSKTEMLYRGEAPGAVGQEEADIPRLTISLADQNKATGTAVIVCPGGGYGAPR